MHDFQELFLYSYTLCIYTLQLSLTPTLIYNMKVYSGEQQFVEYFIHI